MVVVRSGQQERTDEDRWFRERIWKKNKRKTVKMVLGGRREDGMKWARSEVAKEREQRDVEDKGK